MNKVFYFNQSRIKRLVISFQITPSVFVPSSCRSQSLSNSSCDFFLSSDDPTSTLTLASRDRLQQIFAQLPKKGLPRQSSIENTLRGISHSSTMLPPSLRRKSICLLSLFTSLLISSVSSAPPPISVRLQASWQSPQLPLEILFLLFSINSDN